MWLELLVWNSAFSERDVKLLVYESLQGDVKLYCMLLVLIIVLLRLLFLKCLFDSLFYFILTMTLCD